MAPDLFIETVDSLRFVSENSAWQRERHQLVRLILLLTAVTATAGLIYAWQVGVFVEMGIPFALLCLAGLIGLWVLGVFGNALPYLLQALTFLGVVYGLGLIDLVRVGFIGQGPMLMFLLVVMAFALFNLRVSLVAVAIATGTLATAGWMSAQGRIVFDVTAQMSAIMIPNPILEILRFGGILFLLTYFSYRIVVTARQALLEQAYMTQELGNERREVERRVSERTKALGVASEISRLLSTVRDQRQLQVSLVNLIQQAFDYYYVQMFVVDPDRDQMRLVAGTGTAGKLLLAQQHSLELGVGIVGRAGMLAETVFKPYVALSKTWRPNPLLPYTRAEVAVPVMMDGEVWGVLDVQHDRAGELTAEDTNFIESVASQLTVALDNIRRYEAAQSRAEREAMLHQIAYKIQLAPEPDMLIKMVTRELGRGLGADRVAIEIEGATDEISAEGEPL